MPAAAFHASDSTTVTLADGRVVVSFGGCNYLGLANHPAAVAAVQRGLETFGLSASASRETTGNAAPHELLEQELAAFLGMERGLLVPDGYIANIAACQGLARSGTTHAVIDARGHASLADAARTAELGVVKFAHSNPAALRDTLRTIRPGAAVVMTDGVFTAHGEPAPLAALLEQLGPDDRLLVDDCHGLGVVGPGGRGSATRAGLDDPRVVVTSSLAKGLGCAGGIVAGSAEIISDCHAAAGYICTTPIAPAMAEGTRASLKQLLTEPARVERLQTNAARVRAGLHDLELLPLEEDWTTPIAAFTLDDLPAMERLAAGLLAEGYRVPLIRYPNGPAEAYFRLSVNAMHTEAQINGLLHAIATLLGKQIGTQTGATSIASSSTVCVASRSIA